MPRAARRLGRAGHRRLARHRRGGGAGAGRLGAHCVLTARTQGALEEIDDAIRAAGAARARCCRSTSSRTARSSTCSAPPSCSASAGSTCWCMPPALLAKLTPVAHIMPRDWQEAVAVNITACWRMIRTCDPPLRAAPAGRAVVLTDGLVADAARLLGPLRLRQGGAGASRRGPGRRRSRYAAAGEPGRSRPGRHPAARHRHAGRGPGGAAPAGGCRAGHRRALPAPERTAPPPHGAVGRAPRARELPPRLPCRQFRRLHQARAAGPAAAAPCGASRRPSACSTPMPAPAATTCRPRGRADRRMARGIGRLLGYRGRAAGRLRRLVRAAGAAGPLPRLARPGPRPAAPAGPPACCELHPEDHAAPARPLPAATRRSRSTTAMAGRRCAR